MKFITNYQTLLTIAILCTIVSEQLLVAAELMPDNHLSHNEPIQPIPINVISDPRKVALGEQLFHETLLSADNSISCATCHDLKNWGMDGKQFSTGIYNQTGTVNTPTVMNSGFNFVQFWDGRAASLEEQAKGPITNPLEMGTTWKEVLDKLQQQKNYYDQFRTIYPQGITEDTITDAIKHFELTLLTVDSPFDLYLRGDQDAITQQQKKGYSLFKNYGCVACHQGVNVGGNMYQRLGSFLPYFTTKEKNTSKQNLGRYNVTQNETDKYVFKVPSLRLAAQTAPYFHDGSVNTLEEAINIMAKHQLGLKIPVQDVADIIAFIESLSGTYRHRIK